MEKNIEEKIRTLCNLMRYWKIPQNVIDEDGFRTGCTDYYIKLFYYLFQEYSEEFVTSLGDNKIKVRYPFAARQKTLREIYSIIKILGTEENIIPFTQFCTDGYAEKKVMLMREIITSWYVRCGKSQQKPVMKTSRQSQAVGERYMVPFERPGTSSNYRFIARMDQQTVLTHSQNHLFQQVTVTQSFQSFGVLQRLDFSEAHVPHQEEGDLIARMASICLEDWAEFTDQTMPQ